MGLKNWITDGHYCNSCGEFFPKSVLVTLKGYGDSSGTYCTICANEKIEDEMEE